jgi:uncharacterized membrane protein
MLFLIIAVLHMTQPKVVHTFTKAQVSQVQVVKTWHNISYTLQSPIVNGLQ